MENQLGLALTANEWAKGLSKEQQIDWLVDCYRMRQDDNFVWAADRSGLYDPEDGVAGIVRIFLLFCKCAVRGNALPRGPWNWAKFLKHAAIQVVHFFDKSDAKEKYGSESVYNVLTGGRSLRVTAEMIYGASAIYYDGTAVSEHNQPVERAMNRVDFYDKDARNFEQVAELFEDVGGHALWTKFVKEVRAKYVPPVAYR